MRPHKSNISQRSARGSNPVLLPTKEACRRNTCRPTVRNFGVGGRQSARAPGLSLPPTTDVPPDSSRGGNRTHNRLTRLSTWPLCRFAYSAVRQAPRMGIEPTCIRGTTGSRPQSRHEANAPLRAVAQVGVEPTAFEVLSPDGLPGCLPSRVPSQCPARESNPQAPGFKPGRSTGWRSRASAHSSTSRAAACDSGPPLFCPAPSRCSQRGWI